MSSSSSVKGTPACAGVYRGPARVVTRLEDAKTIQKVVYTFFLMVLITLILLPAMVTNKWWY